MFKISKGLIAIPPEDYVTRSTTATQTKHDFKLNTFFSITGCFQIQSNLDYPDFSIIRTFSLVPFFSWILISFDLKSFQR